MRLVLVFIILLSINGFAQNYQPFNSDQSKRFEAVVPDTNLYYFHCMDADTLGEVISMEQYLTLSNIVTDSVIAECGGWGDYYPQMDTTWLNRNITWNSSHNTLVLKNRYNDSLTFNFGMSLGDSSIFYQSATEKYFLKYEFVSEEQFLDSLDSVRTYSILKYDLSDNSLVSSFDDFHVKLSKRYGLGSFIDCKRFPQEEVAVQLAGQYYPVLGYYRMTFDEAFPWNAGDTIQVKGTMPYVTSYKTFSITNRVETSDSVFIYFDENEYISAFNPSTSSGYNIEYTNPIAYKKGKSLTNVPEGDVSQYPVVISTTDFEEYCGQRKAIRFSQENFQYCEECHCLSPLEASKATDSDFSYVQDLGMQNKRYWAQNNLNPFTNHAEVIYSNIGGVTCGAFSSAGQNELEFKVSIQPNPVQDMLSVSSEKEMESIRIIDASGKLVLTFVVNSLESEVDMSKLNSGIYFTEIHFSNSTKSVQKIFKN